MAPHPFPFLDGAFRVQALVDGRTISVSPMLWGNARLWIGNASGIDNSF